MIEYVERDPTTHIVFHNGQPIAKILFYFASQKWQISALRGVGHFRGIRYGECFKSLAAAKRDIAKSLQPT